MKVGDKVVCVKSYDGMFYRGEITPKKDEVYTVRESYSVDGIPAIRLEEIVNPVFNYKDGITECGFRQDYFRPVQPKRKGNKLTKKLANEAMREMVEYNPMELPKHLEV